MTRGVFKFLVQRSVVKVTERSAVDRGHGELVALCQGSERALGARVIGAKQKLVNSESHCS